MVKMTIIEVNLGQNIDDIINEDVEKMTEQTMRNVDEAIAEKKTVETERMMHIQQKTNEKQQIKNTLESIYKTLIKTTEQNSCLSLEDMAKLAKPVIPNTSALILQMKSFIRKEKGNDYVLKRRTMNKKPVYVLIPFNAVD